MHTLYIHNKKHFDFTFFLFGEEKSREPTGQRKQILFGEFRFITRFWVDDIPFMWGVMTHTQKKDLKRKKKQKTEDRLILTV